MNKNYRSLIISLTFTFVLLFILFKYISINEIIGTLRIIKLKFFLIGLLFHLLAYISRTIILNSFIGKDKNSFFNLLSVHFIHNFYSQVIPASLGELSFPILLKKQISMSKSISVLLILRILTTIVTLVLFIISLFSLFSIIDVFNFHLTKGYLLLSVLLLGVLLLFLNRKIIYQRLIKINYIKKILHRLSDIVKTLKHEFIKLRKFSFLIKISFFALLSNIGIILFYLIMLYNLGIKLNLFQIIFVSSIGLVFLILPIKSIGGFGTTEGSWAIGLMLMGITRETAIQAGFVIHIIALLNVIIFLLIGLLIRVVPEKQRDIKRINNEI